jgi:integrase
MSPGEPRLGRMTVVSKRLGHPSVRTTLEIYAHAIHGSDDEAVRKWEGYQARNRQPSQATKDGQ